MLDVRPARPEDVEALLDLAEARRAAYAAHQPQFWRPAPEARRRQRPHVHALLADADAVVLVAGEGADLGGFLIGRLLPAPPVYDPGGLTCVVDDFAVIAPDRWSSVGPLLLAALRGWAGDRGAVQLVVVTAHLDEAQRAALRGSGLTIASEWWVGPVG